MPQPTGPSEEERRILEQELCVPLRRLRRDAGDPSYEEIAERAELSRSTVYNAFKAHSRVSSRTIVAIAVALGGDRDEWRRRWVVARDRIDAANGASARDASRQVTASEAPPTTMDSGPNRQEQQSDQPVQTPPVIPQQAPSSDDDSQTLRQREGANDRPRRSLLRTRNRLARATLFLVTAVVLMVLGGLVVFAVNKLILVDPVDAAQSPYPTGATSTPTPSRAAKGPRSVQPPPSSGGRTCDWEVTWSTAGVYEEPRRDETILVKRWHRGDVVGPYCATHRNADENETYVKVQSTDATDKIGWMRLKALRPV